MPTAAPLAHLLGGAPAAPAPGTNTASSSAADALCTAAARGDLAAVTAALAVDPSLATKCDARGFYPLAWAALNDQPAVVAALLRAGAVRTARDPAGQTALHWSAARGAVAAAEALLTGIPSTTATALLTAADAQGYTPSHVAAQHDAPAWLHRAAAAWPGGLSGVRAARDAHERTPLHWAAYKGAGATRLLLVVGADASATDDEGATPLHWASLKGHLDACLLLIRAGTAGHRVGGAAVLGLRDATGAAPVDLARSRGHTALAGRLEEEAARAGVKVSSEDAAALPLLTPDALRPHARKRGLACLLASAHLSPLTLLLALALGWGFEAGVVWVPGAPPPGRGMVAAGALVGGLAVVGCGLLVRTARTDPGVLPVHPSTDGGAMVGALPSPPPSPTRSTADPAAGSTDALSHPAFSHTSPSPPDWARLCVACRSVRPLRAKHCGTTGVCVTRYDHYCPWTGCVVGAGNQGAFVGMLLAYATAACLAGLVAAGRLLGVMGAPSPPPPATGSPTAASFSIILFLIFDVAVALAVSVLACVQVRQVGANLTTAEAVGGARKHPYLRGPTGRGFVNPFDKGSCLRNWREVVWTNGGGGVSSSASAAGRGRAAVRGRGRGGGGGVSGASPPPGRAGRRVALGNRGMEMV